MPIGPGKYDDLRTHAREAEKARWFFVLICANSLQLLQLRRLANTEN